MASALTRRITAALAAVALAACAGHVPPGTDGPTLRVLTWNIHAGRNMDGVLDIERMADVIRAERPHVVALQEVDRGTARAGGRDLLEELARATGMRWAFGANLDFQGGRFGNAILSILPLRDIANHPLPIVDGGEQRGALVATIETAAGPVRIIATHLDHRPRPAERLASIARIDSIADDRPVPTILAGDLNDVPGSETLTAVRATWTLAGSDGASFPADHPQRRIDFVAYRPSTAWRVIEERVLDEGAASDHRPVLAVLRRQP